MFFVKIMINPCLGVHVYTQFWTIIHVWVCFGINSKAWGWLKHTIGTYGKLSRGQLSNLFQCPVVLRIWHRLKFQSVAKTGADSPIQYQCRLQAASNFKIFTIYNYSKIYCRFICKKIGMSLSWNRKNTIPFSKVQKIFFQFAMIQCPVLSNDSYQPKVLECY